jgi:epoxyqueuosine reductase QueG
MGCEICGRWNCKRQYHDKEERDAFDATSGMVKENLKENIETELDKLDTTFVDDLLYVKLQDVIDIVRNAD